MNQPGLTIRAYFSNTQTLPMYYSRILKVFSPEQLLVHLLELLCQCHPDPVFVPETQYLAAAAAATAAAAAAAAAALLLKSSKTEAKRLGFGLLHGRRCQLFTSLSKLV